MLAAIQQKVEGQEIVSEPAAETGTKILDLMEALRNSVKGKKATGDQKRAARKRPAKRHRKAA